jgi:DNA polymerase
MIVNLDFETRSKVDLKVHGLDQYARDASTEIICMAYSANNNPIQIWLPGNPVPTFFVEPTTRFQAWNAAFEYNIMKHVLHWPVTWEQMIDSMAIAAANNIPQGLDDAAIFVGATQQKDAIGKRLIQKLSKPSSKGEFNKEPDLLRQMYDYCKQDVRTEMAVVGKLVKLTESEQAIWVLTQKINDRGVPVDMKGINYATACLQGAKAEIDQEIKAITGGASANQTVLLLSWLEERGYKLTDITGETVDNMLVSINLPPNVKRVLELRQLGSQTSTAKYEKMREVQVENRIRNTLVYHGASTGRWASRGGLNLQNIARPSLGDEALQKAIERVLERGEGGSMEELSSLVRSVIKAPKGYVFVDADFSSIENRVASWIAGQTDKVEMFRNGLDEYKTFASTSLFKVPYEEVTKDMRQIAKSAVLGCMFGQGDKGLTKYAAKMGVLLSEVQSQEAVRAYRNDYSQVKSKWAECDKQARLAIENEKIEFKTGKLCFEVKRNALWMRLPSGRVICWREPKIEEQETPWGDLKNGISVLSQNTFSRQWKRNPLIGSSIFQSAVQATARDMLAEACLNLEANGFEVLNLIHDEVLLMVPEDQADKALEQVLNLITIPPKWAPNFPLSAEGWVGERYRK